MRTFCGLRRVVCGIAALALLTAGPAPAQKRPAADGLVFGTDSTGRSAPFAVKQADGWYTVSATGYINTKYYPQMRMTSDICTMTIVVADANGDPDPTQPPKVFSHTEVADPDKGTFSIDSGTTRYAKGVYLIVTVRVRVKETPTSLERDAYVISRLMCDGPPGGGA